MSYIVQTIIPYRITQVWREVSRLGWRASSIQGHSWIRFSLLVDGNVSTGDLPLPRGPYSFKCLSPVTILMLMDTSQSYPKRGIASSNDKRWYISKAFGFSYFPNEVFPVPRSWIETTGNLVFWRDHQKVRTLAFTWFCNSLLTSTRVDTLQHLNDLSKSRRTWRILLHRSGNRAKRNIYHGCIWSQNVWRFTHSQTCAQKSIFWKQIMYTISWRSPLIRSAYRTYYW